MTTVGATDAAWREVARGAGMTADGRLNAATIAIDQQRALIWQRSDGTSVVFSGTDLQQRAVELASCLAAIGIERGDRVGGMLGRRPDSFALPLAVWRLGAIYVPLFNGFGSDALAVRLSDSGARALVVDADNAPAAAQIRDRFPELKTIIVDGDGDGLVDETVDALLRSAPREPSLCETSATDTATIMYTSGTSGTPKGCMIPHYGAITLWPYVKHCLALKRDAVLFSSADAGWSFGLYTTGLAPMSLGVTRVLYEGGFDPTEWWRIVKETKAEHFASAPTGYRQLAAAGAEAMGDPPPSLVAGTSCGEPLTSEVVTWFRDHLGFSIHDSYGLTEVGILVANLRAPEPDITPPGSMGRLLPGFDIRLVDHDLREVPDGEAGRVAIRDHGWLLSRGYWDRSEEWDSRLHDGWWVSEDLARREHGDYWYIGRADDVIVTAGYNVGPTDVEEILLDHPAIVDAACVSEPDARKGHHVAAHVVLSGDEEHDPEQLLEDVRQAVGERLGWHSAPRRLHLVETLPRTESGKVRRRELRENQA